MKEEFESLKENWKKETWHLSNISDICTNPNYQKIIGLGMAVVPFILEDLEEKPNHWFWALKAITGEDPVPEEHRGRLHQMAEDWIQWGKENGYDSKLKFIVDFGIKPGEPTVNGRVYSQEVINNMNFTNKPIIIDYQYFQKKSSRNRIFKNGRNC